MIAFYGRYDAENPPLIDVLAGKAAKKKRRMRYLDPEVQWRLLGDAVCRHCTSPQQNKSSEELRNREPARSQARSIRRSGRLSTRPHRAGVSVLGVPSSRRK